jgi:ParB family transcriptional regulator, chromosome partitioning protein
MNAATREVREISPDEIEKNPQNPRLIFRPEELDSLLASIKRFGIQVPITVYRDKKLRKFVLIDGERRWRCARKLNLLTIPALVQPEPSELDNLLLMFNIHALREQWDYLTIASKLPRVIELHVRQHEREPNELELSEATGLSRGQIRRCRLLLDLPEGYRDTLLAELELPKGKQRLSEDFFIEMERAIKTVQNRVEGAVKNVDAVRNVLIAKYRAHTINNITDFRMLSKIATSVRGLGVDEKIARSALKEIFSPQGAGVSEIFEARFGHLYDERKMGRQIDAVIDYLNSIILEDLDDGSELLKIQLSKLRSEIDRILQGA